MEGGIWRNVLILPRHRTAGCKGYQTSVTHNGERFCEYCHRKEGGQTSQDCRRESRDTNHKSLASMGNCTSERREPNLLRGTRQRRNGSSQHTLSLGWRRDLGIVLGYLGDRTPRSRTVPIGDLLVRVVPTVACHVCPFSGVVGCICSHLCCLFAFCVEENKNENKTNNKNGGVGEID